MNIPQQYTQKTERKIYLNDIQVNRMQKKVRRTIFDTMKSKTQREDNITPYLMFSIYGVIFCFLPFPPYVLL